MTEQNVLSPIGGRQTEDVVEQKEILLSIQEISNGEDQKWDDFLAHTAGGSHLQTSKWARVKIWLGWKVFRVVATRENKIIGGAQIFFRSLRLGKTIGYIPRGPVLAQRPEPRRKKRRLEADKDGRRDGALQPCLGYW